MAPKKRNAETADGNAAKRPRSRYSGSTKSTMNPNFGQRAVFGDFECSTTVPTGDSDLECEDDADALAYLQSVRTQASTIPHVIVAGKAGPRLPPQALVQPSDDLGHQQKGQDEVTIDRSIYRSGVGDFRGFYQDGAYTAYPPGYNDEVEKEDLEEDYGDDENYDYEEGEDVEPELDDDYDYDESSSESSEGRPHNSSADEIRDAYFASLMNQYLSLRKLLHREPPRVLLSSLPATNPTEVGEFGRWNDTFVKWSGRLRGTDPLPVQIAGMHKDGVLRLLRIILGDKFLRKRHELRPRTSRWIWALLGRLPERGELGYQEIGLVRDLGKRAVLLMVSLAEMEVLEEHCDVGDGTEVLDEEVEIEDGGDEEISLEESWDYDDPEVDVNDGEDATAVAANGTQAKAPAGADPSAPEEATEASSDVEMQLESDAEVEDGEVSEAPNEPEESTADIETAKARLLEQLDAAEADTAEPAPTSLIEEAFAALDEEEAAREKEELQAAKINERLTLNMILTVVGEFYGQRDLLEFRDPFNGVEIDDE
ncbi:hypothetical protein F4804DRAFT_310814 [Jackrogersella minutella]|nr:hypothetical protein F4804DRAFT_310814 [Jackrogersella minutella]